MIIFLLLSLFSRYICKKLLLILVGCGPFKTYMNGAFANVGTD